MKKQYLAIITVLIIALGASVFVWQKQAVQEQLKEEVGANIDKQEQFVTDVDPDVSHWQTKETGFLTIKFPKEWYLVEISVEEPGANGAFVISNNKNFSLEEYKNDAFNMTGLQHSVLKNTEVAITIWGTATSNSGTPLDSLSYLVDGAKEFDPTAKCTQPLNIKILPIIASCLVKQENHQAEHKYYVIDKINSLIITARTTDDTIVPENVLGEIARNIKINY